jgi:hypothetical protein
MVGLTTTALFGWFFWPTPYAYTRFGESIHMVNRYTGVKFVSSGDGWQNTAQQHASQIVSPTSSRQKTYLSGLMRATPASGNGGYKCLPGVIIGSRRLRSSLSIMYDPYSACLRYRFGLSPYEENLLNSACVTVMFQNEGGFTVQTERLSIGECMQVSPDGKKFTEYLKEGKVFMTAEQYAGIQAFNCSWEGL